MAVYLARLARRKVVSVGKIADGILVGPREAFEAMNRAIAQHGMRPVIDRTFPFEEAPAAFELMAAGGHFGKICIRV